MTGELILPPDGDPDRVGTIAASVPVRCATIPADIPIEQPAFGDERLLVAFSMDDVHRYAARHTGGSP